MIGREEHSPAKYPPAVCTMPSRESKGSGPDSEAERLRQKGRERVGGSREGETERLPGTGREKLWDGD